MNFSETALRGVYIIDPERVVDVRGFFARTWCEREFMERGLNCRLVQCSVSANRLAGTLRGLHYQAEPRAEAKLVRCTMGAIYDVVVDLRQESPTFRQWVAVELSAQNRRMLYVAEGCAHGFMTLEHDSEVFYQMSEYYVPELARGVRWNDPAFGVSWPRTEGLTMSGRDSEYGDFVW